MTSKEAFPVLKNIPEGELLALPEFGPILDYGAIIETSEESVWDRLLEDGGSLPYLRLADCTGWAFLQPGLLQEINVTNIVVRMRTHHSDADDFLYLFFSHLMVLGHHTRRFGEWWRYRKAKSFRCKVF